MVVDFQSRAMVNEMQCTDRDPGNASSQLASADRGIFALIAHTRLAGLTPLVLPGPANERIFGRIAQLADGGPEALAKLDVELDDSDSVFVGIHEVLPGSPSF